MQVNGFLMKFLYRRPFARLAFLWRFLHLLAVVAYRSKSDSRRTGAMTFDPNHEEHLRELQQELHRAHTITSAINPGVIARACPRLQAQHRAASATVIRLIESGAFAEALALLDLELPQWKLRRLIR